MTIAKGTIHVLTEKGSDNTPNKYSDLYPKTSADQVTDLDTTIEEKVASMISYDAIKTSGDVIGTLIINNTDHVLYSTPDTHYTSKLIAGTSNSTVNAVTTNGNTYLRLFDDSTVRNSIKITGSGATSVTSDNAGIITVNSTDTTYSVATTSANGLMSTTDKIKLDNLTDYTLPTASETLKGGIKIGSGLSMDGDTLNVTIQGDSSEGGGGGYQSSGYYAFNHRWRHVARCE